MKMIRPMAKTTTNVPPPAMAPIVLLLRGSTERSKRLVRGAIFVDSEAGVVGLLLLMLSKRVEGR